MVSLSRGSPLNVISRIMLMQRAHRIIPYGITVGALTEVFVWAMLFRSFQRKLLPNHVMMLAWIMFALYLTGFIETAIQLFGPILPACKRWVDGRDDSGLSYDTLVWLTQARTCESWYIIISFWGTGGLMLIWIIILAYNVQSKSD